MFVLLFVGRIGEEVGGTNNIVLHLNNFHRFSLSRQASHALYLPPT